MRAVHKEDGFALVTAVVLLTVILGLGLGLLLLTDNQQKASAREQSSEQAFNVAEAALNAQVGQLARVWPTLANRNVAVTRCTEGLSDGKNYCPPNLPLSVGYGKLSKVACAAGAQTDAWGSPITNQWTTYVRATKGGTSYFNSKTEETEPEYAPPAEAGNKELENKLWVRAVGVVNCRVVSLVTLVSRQLVSVPFPKDVLGGNWFEITNSGGHGSKGIVNGLGEFGTEKGEVGMRCEPPRVAGHESGQCETFENEPKSHKEQFENYKPGPPPPSPVLNEEQLATVRALAEANGTLRSPALGNCPKTAEELSGSPAYIEGCGNLSLSGNGAVNSAANPGFLVLTEGTLTLTGGNTWYGVIYVRNPANLETGIVKLSGSVTVYGAIEVDGKGGIELGSSSVNLVYNPEGIVNLKGSAGATPTRNTFRVLPISQ
jgi:Tfp pilus assembly protein PilX